jgi:hypothetical protein
MTNEGKRGGPASFDSAALLEAIERTQALDALATQGLELLGDTGPVQRAVIRQTAKKGLRMSLEELHDEVLRAALLLAELAEGDLTLEEARPGIEQWRAIVVGTIDFVESLEHLVDTYVKTPEQRDRVLSLATEKLEDAHALVAALDRLARRGL